MHPDTINVGPLKRVHLDTIKVSTAQSGAPGRLRHPNGSIVVGRLDPERLEQPFMDPVESSVRHHDDDIPFAQFGP